MAAKDMLPFSASQAGNGSKFTFLHSPAESIHNSLPPSSIDFASVASMFFP